MLTKRLFCLKCGREAQDSGEYYHCPGCGQYQQVVFYELQEGRRPEQRFEWRDVETKQRTESPEPIHNSGRGMLDVIQPLAIREQQKRQEQGPGGESGVVLDCKSEAAAEPGSRRDRSAVLKPDKGNPEQRFVHRVPAPGPSKVPSDVQGEATRKASTPPLKPDTNEERPISRAVSSRGEREEPGVKPTAGGISKVAPRRASTTEVQTQDEAKGPDQQQAQPKPKEKPMGRPRKVAPKELPPICQRIKELREYTGLGVKAFAAKVGLHWVVPTKIEGGRVPRQETVQKIIDAFPAVDSVWLLAGRGQMLKPVQYQESPEVLKAELKDKGAQEIDYSQLADALLEKMGGADAVTKAIVDGLYVGLTGKYISFEFGGR